jgi:hypothetical protein
MLVLLLQNASMIFAPDVKGIVVNRIHREIDRCSPRHELAQDRPDKSFRIWSHPSRFASNISLGTQSVFVKMFI